MDNPKWKSTNDELPSSSDPMVIQIRDKHSEKTDIKVATYSDGEWKILPPYPRFDFSPMSNYEHIDENAYVMEWRNITDDELSFWEHRFDKIRSYDTLEIHTDDKNAKDVYRALMWGAALIERHADNDNAYLADILYDLQHYMDIERGTNNGLDS